MLVKEVLIQTNVMKPGMLVRDVFEEYVRDNVEALPYSENGDDVTGRISLDYIIREACLSEYMLDTAHLLGDFLSCVDHTEEKASEVLARPVEPFVRKARLFIASDAPAVKAMALMEQHDTHYLFVRDDGQYKGMVTKYGIAKRMLELVEGVE
ncbi:MAG: CBS domain-containing protein [Gammaproteobacteria bacterium]|nr:CBS domain-containing protein [Gammaproteobacteria bacterium]